ncbi:hypothetical protein CVE34_01440 [Pseudomonas syringae pv. actinidiae]|nr:hypothetical protein [Pseudomonas syringae pv. actinidiae]
MQRRVICLQVAAGGVVGGNMPVVTGWVLNAGVMNLSCWRRMGGQEDKPLSCACQLRHTSGLVFGWLIQ